MARAPPGPRSLATVVHRCARSISRSFMAKQGREGCEQEQDYLSHPFQVTINNSPRTGLIDLEVKCAGARSAVNPHAACDVAGVGNGATD